MKCCTLFFCCFVFYCCKATGVANTQTDGNGIGNIKSTKLYKSGDQTSFPAIALNGNDALELHFDDLDADIKNYYYSFQLCNWDWSPSVLHTFEYTKGFQNVRITNYRNSSLSTIRYTHYQAVVPDRNSYPSRSGNYVLKVFINGDTSKLAFSKRFVVIDNKAAVAAQLQQPFNSQIFRTHQKLQIGITTDNRIQLFGPQDLKVLILQNSNWQTALALERPTIYRGNYYEYSDESITAMPAGKEWRWIDLRSYRLKSDRMENINTRGDTTEVYVKKEGSRNGQIYVYYRDVNGRYVIETLENINPFWQGEYGSVNFTYQPPGNQALPGNDVYIFGELTNFAEDASGKMEFNEEKGVYEKTLFLKQGFYNYNYITQPTDKKGYPDFSVTEGNYWGTENTYTVLVYYRPFGARADELIGYAAANSTFSRVGF
ncbi:MAG: DUF5103 domain-containing protein [Bacteroidota bacterium]|nr:DUF5103 domain-containing protein [Bacteroidota bacterium]